MVSASQQPLATQVEIPKPGSSGIHYSHPRIGVPGLVPPGSGCGIADRDVLPPLLQIKLPSSAYARAAVLGQADG